MDLRRYVSKLSLQSAVHPIAPERIAAVLALTGTLIAIFSGFRVHEWQQSGSDFKTLYASAWCFAHGFDAYSFRNIGQVFAANHVVAPLSWYAHAPVYPPFTLAVLAVTTALPMAPAVYLWIILSAAVMAAAAAALARMAGESFGLTRPWRLLLIALVAASPLISFSLEVGNVSVLVAALCILAILPTGSGGPWPRAIPLALGLLLKPHVAFWVLLALALIPSQPARSGRAVAWRAIALGAIFTAFITLVLLQSHQLWPQVTSYLAMVHAETSGGSMASGSREFLSIPAQITSLASLLGFWLRPPLLTALQITLLASLAALLLAASLRAQPASPDRAANLRLELIGAWCCFGLLATYHRAHDAIVLLLLLPCVLARLRTSWRQPSAWAIILLVIALSAGREPATVQIQGFAPALRYALGIIIYRQAPLAAALLMLTLLATLWYDRRRQLRAAPHLVPSHGLPQSGRKLPSSVLASSRQAPSEGVEPRRRAG